MCDFCSLLKAVVLSELILTSIPPLLTRWISIGPFTCVQVEKVATGFMGMVGNKGGIAIKVCERCVCLRL